MRTMITSILMNLNLISNTMSIKNHYKKIRIFKHQKFVEEQAVKTRMDALTLIMRYATGIVSKETFMEKIEMTAEQLKKRENYLNDIKKFTT